jgi:hypothetical protein
MAQLDKSIAVVPSAHGEPIEIDLRDPWVAAFLAWLVPGLGHMYQRRWGKGGLFMTCILGTFFYGLWLGGGRVVYASFRDGDSHYAYLCQVGAGLPALPAVVQSIRTGGPTPKAPLFDGIMAPPIIPGQIVPRAWVQSLHEENPNDPMFAVAEGLPGGGGFKYFDSYETYLRFHPPQPGEVSDQLGQWHRSMGTYFDLGTVFTMIAGLLNILVVFDAWGGPALPITKAEEVEKKESEKEKKSN